MTSYKIGISDDGVMNVGFGDPAGNDQIVKDAKATLDALARDGKLGGPILKISGPASLPVAMTIAHSVCHLFGAVAVFDPKLQGFVVSITHSPDYRLGDILPK